MSVNCKNINDIHYFLWGNPGDSVFSDSKILSDNNNYFDVNKLIDMRMFKFHYYDEWPTNNHHITTESYRKIVLPFLRTILWLPYDANDFIIEPYFSKEKKFNCSYSVPKNENLRFTLIINGKTVATQKNYTQIKAKTHILNITDYTEGHILVLA